MIAISESRGQVATVSIAGDLGIYAVAIMQAMEAAGRLIVEQYNLSAEGAGGVQQLDGSGQPLRLRLMSDPRVICEVTEWHNPSYVLVTADAAEGVEISGRTDGPEVPVLELVPQPYADGDISVIQPVPAFAEV